MQEIKSDVMEYIESFYKPLDAMLEDLREEGESNRVPIILKDTESLLKTILVMHKPKNILEIGTAIGYSASFMAKLLPETKIISIEKNSEMAEIARQNIRKLKIDDRIKILEGDAKECLITIQDSCDFDEQKPFDFLFIDAAKSHYKEFWDLSQNLLAQDAIIVCDNILMKGMTASEEYDKNKKYKTSIRKMREFLEYISNLEDISTTILAVGDGVSVSKIDKEMR